MTTLDHADRTAGSAPGLLDRERIIAAAGFNRWMVPPAALCIHLCIGMAYGFTVFWFPLSVVLGLDKSVACPDMSLFGFQIWPPAIPSGPVELFTTSCDWRVSSLNGMYTLFFVLLGSSAALWGGWLERVGPRKAGVVAAVCWCGGLVIAAGGVVIHQLWVLWLGAGVIGGVGLGLGYISPVSTLVKWFPDRRGMATGMAIMGFGGGAMIGSPLAQILMDGGKFIDIDAFGLTYALSFPGFKSAAGPGVWQTFLVMAAGYFVFMLAGAFGYRVPPAGWRPDGWTPPANTKAMITQQHVHLDDAHKTAQFWLIWGVLCLNVSAGIGMISMASPIMQEVFGAPAAIAAGFAGLLSLFNIGGRFFWASLSDYIGRKNTYFTFFLLGTAMYALSPWAAHSGHQALFVIFFCVILSMYGGGFATVPAYLADIFGTQFVGAIHGRLLTAWSAAGIIGPILVTNFREYKIGQGVPKDQVYDLIMYIMAGLVVAGFICNLLVRPLKEKWFMKPEEVAALQAKQGGGAAVAGSYGIGKGGLDAPAALFWLFVGIPLAWGVYKTLLLAARLF
jgi:MFS family permease